jgi:GT2 family glycosyltransferase
LNRPSPIRLPSKSEYSETLPVHVRPAVDRRTDSRRRSTRRTATERAEARSILPERATRDLSIVIVSYNTRDILRECLRSVVERTDVPFEVIVVDNASRDGSARMVREEFPEVRLISNSRNEGYSCANNQGFRVSRGRYILLLNSDTIVLPGTLRSLVEFLEDHPDVGIAGCRLERPNGDLDLACRRSFPTPMVSLCRFLTLSRVFPSSRRLARYNLTYLDPAGSYEVDSIVGAFMLVRREVIEQMGGLDESYFMYGEDLDWCYRARQQDWRVWYVGSERVIHYKGASSSQESFRMNYHFHRAMYLFHSKHLSARYPAAVNGLVYLGILARLSALALQHPLRKLIQALDRRASRGRVEKVYPYEFFLGASVEDGA